MQAIEKLISPLIEQQFPGVYRDEGPVFVQFVKAYFEWMEDVNNPLYHSRRMLEYRDIDETVDDFLIHFQRKYLNGLPLDSRTNIRNIVKHSLDIYRSKGSERGIDLLFKLVFGVAPKFYYPADDIFRTSDNKWVVPRYLEVTLLDTNFKLQNKQVYGLKSGAVAFVDRGVRRTVNGVLVDVLYISAISGTFKTGEKIAPSDGSLDVKDCPSIIGSLTNVLVPVSGVGSNFEVGDIVDITGSTNGIGGKARVAAISDITGIITLEDFDGGFGYSEDAVPLVSDKVFSFANVSVNANVQYYWQLFETIYQPKAIINYRSATGNLAIGDFISAYTSNVVTGYGEIYSVTASNSTAGSIEVFVRSGNLNVNQFFTTANAVSANLAVSNGYNDRTATANIMGIANSVTIHVSNISQNYLLGEGVKACNSANVVIASGVITDFAPSGTNAQITISPFYGVFRSALTLYGCNSGANSVVGTSDIDLGVISVTNTFVTTENNFVYGLLSGSNGTITDESSGSGANIGFDANTLTNIETANVNTDLLRDYGSTSLAATAYNFPASTSANAGSNIALTQTWQSINVGSIYTIRNFSPGEGYNRKPFMEIYDVVGTGPGKGLIALTVSTNGQFVVGETVRQDASDAVGIIQEYSSDYMLIKPLSLQYDFVQTTNSTTIVTGDSLGGTANISFITPVVNSRYAGFNFLANTDLNNGGGAITELQVIDSGFGYIDGETVTVSKDGNEATGQAELLRHGKSQGYFRNRSGFLSSDKYLYDGRYYQEFSYEIRSPIAIDKYRDLLKQVMHVIGTQLFGAFYHEAQSNSSMSTSKVKITVS